LVGKITYSIHFSRPECLVNIIKQLHKLDSSLAITSEITPC